MLETLWFWSEEAAINTDKLLVAEAGDRNIAFLLAGDKILQKHNQKYGCGLKKHKSIKRVEETILYNQKQVWMHRVALRNNRTQFRGNEGIMDLV